MRQAECKCYYGELPLSFACCTNQANFVALLLERAAAAVYLGSQLAQIEAQLELLRAKDSFGNNVLHHCTIHSMPHMYDYVAGEWRKLVKARGQTKELMFITADEEVCASSGRRTVPLQLLPPQRADLTSDRVSQAVTSNVSELEDSVNLLGDTPLATASRFGSKASPRTACGLFSSPLAVLSIRAVSFQMPVQ